MRVNFPLLLPLLLHLGATALGVLILGFIPHQNKSYPSQTQLTDFDIATFTHHVTTTVAGITATSHNTEAWWYYDRTCSSPPIGTLSCTKYWNVTDPEEGSGGIVGSVNDLLSSSFDERRGDMEARVLKRSVGWLVPAGLGLHGLLSIVLLALTFGIFRRVWNAFAGL
ncbi:hypothetical protein HK097_007963 [Rhizophlyctis rosea]|uniref:Uncharacterized protein n=1 Tax=Rhizophlyctis rosea TaxID=64517 RepID=A0AAD5SIS4_9FUNG|nr:hypothetical protein HK097_007963 [Rhizophlyctis rosea]